VLHSVKTEFDNFEAVLTSARRRIDQVGSELDKLVGVRTRQIQRKLNHVQSLPEQCDEAESEDTETLPDDE
jgi:DNA recombination protein RmuC